MKSKRFFPCAFQVFRHWSDQSYILVCRHAAASKRSFFESSSWVVLEKKVSLRFDPGQDPFRETFIHSECMHFIKVLFFVCAPTFYVL